MPRGCRLPFIWQSWQISLPVAVETNSFCILRCATVFNRSPCFLLDSFLTDHISTKYNMSSSKKYYIIAFQTCPLTLLCSNVPLMSRDYYVTLHFAGYDYHLHDYWKTHLFNTVWEIFTEYFDKILRPYAWQQQNLYFYLNINTAASHPDKWRNWTALCVTRKTCDFSTSQYFFENIQNNHMV